MRQTVIRGLCAAFALVLGLSLAGCTGVNITAGATRDQAVGSGPLVTARYPGGDYQIVDVRANLEIVYRNEPSDTVTVELQENLLDYLEVSVSQGTLTVNTTKDLRYSDGKMGKLYVSTTSLRRMHLSGAAVIQDADLVTGDSFYMDVSGACDVKMAYDVEKLSVGVSGAGDLNLSGRADDAVLWISGAGNLNAGGLQTRTANVTISGAGSGDISCSEELTAEIGGAGSLTYRGDPVVHKSVYGAGAVTKRN